MLSSSRTNPRLNSTTSSPRTDRRAWLSLALCLGLTASVQAQTGEPPAKLPPVDAVPTTMKATTLEECISMAMSRQPAIAAARASLSAAIDGKAGLDSLRFGTILAPDLPTRKQQACIGISIAAAGVAHSEWEARYCVTRTYWTVQYANEQQKVIDSVIQKLDLTASKAKKLLDTGDPTFKVTKQDYDTLLLHLEFAKAKRAEAEIGMKMATAALREAIGLCLSEPLAIPMEPLPTTIPTVDKEALIAYAMANRAEITQSAGAKEVSDLEIRAQHWSFGPSAKTFAAASDIHAKTIPQGVANGEYRPGAFAPEMPAFLIGNRVARMQRAGDFAVRAGTVVDKTNQLIALEVEAAYLKWQQAVIKITHLRNTPESARKIETVVRDRFNTGAISGEEMLRAQTQVDYAQSQYVEALFNQVLALAALERSTAGGFRMPR